MKIIQKKTEIILNNHVVGNYYKLVLNIPRIAQQAKPGQFVHIRVSDGYQPLLRRPFSIHRVKGQRLRVEGQIEILYEVVGKGTKILSEKKRGEYLDILGPLGNGFNYKPQTMNYKLPILVAGGMGVAPLIFLAEKLVEIKKSLPAGRQEKSILRLRSGLMVSEVEPSKIKILVLLGAKTKDRILCEKEFKELGCEVKVSTDDGSKSFKGKVTELLNHLLSTLYSLLSTSSIYACGSKPMLKEISQISKKYKIPCQISLEENMGCGLGACLGCVVKTKDGYKRVCKDGPIFNTDEIAW